MAPPTNRCGLPFRDAIAEIRDIPADLTARGTDHVQPLVTIAIPTFRRPHLLVEAVRSALRQCFDKPYEIIVADNEVGSDGGRVLMDALPELRSANFRYFVNRENIGLFPNHSRCIQFARGTWVTILNDDDLLDAHYLATMMRALEKRPDVDGIACGKRFIDQRPVAPARPISPLYHERMSPRLVRRYLLSGKAGRTELFDRLADRMLGAYQRFFIRTIRKGDTRRVTPRQLFWAPLTGNIVGFLFRREAGEAIGGFYPEEFPSADDRFYIRFASRYHLRLHKVEAASIRIAENESLRVETVKKALEEKAKLHRLMAGKDVPQWYLRFSPLIISHLWENYRDFWRTEVPREELEKALGSKLPPSRDRLLITVRMLLNAW